MRKIKYKRKKQIKNTNAELFCVIKPGHFEFGFFQKKKKKIFTSMQVSKIN